MTPTDIAKLSPHIRALEEMGCCLVIFTPEELRGAPVDYVQDRLTEYGWDVIDTLATESYDDSMDGDAESALASAGFGTDEDYGYHGEE